MQRALSLSVKDDLWKRILFYLPEFILFETETKLNIGETSFQSQFRHIVKMTAEQPNVADAKEKFTSLISQSLQHEIDKIFKYLQRHTNVFNNLKVRPEFFWEKAVILDILGTDQFGVENSLERRGSGVRRLLMVAFFQYLAEREHGIKRDFIFAVEEPENCLHPRLQRQLVSSFQQLVREKYQVIITSHSPVFVGASPVEDLVLVVRENGVAKTIQTPCLNLSDIAEQLGVEPSDQIIGYNACIFVEGPSDVFFWKTVARKFKEAGLVNADFDDRQIGFIIHGGDTLKHWIDQQAMKRLNRRFGVIVDSDRASAADHIPEKKLNWKQACEAQGGCFFILRKREIENYLHPKAIERSGCCIKPYDEFTDMKGHFGKKVYEVIGDMSHTEILEMDQYFDGDCEHHELLEIVEVLLALPGS